LRKFIFSMLALVLAIGMLVPAAVFANDSGNLEWSGQGTHEDAHGDIVLDNEYCGETEETTDPDVPAEFDNSYLHWIFNTDGGSAEAIPGTTPQLTLGGSGSGTYDYTKHSGNAFHFYTPYFDLNSITAYVTYNVVDPKGIPWIITISHGCPGDDGGGPESTLTVTKTAITSYTRTHDWSIDKSVDTEYGYLHNDLPKVWLYIDGSGDDTATWTIDVTYGGYTDSDWNVSGEIIIENTGDYDAVITNIEDLLGGTDITGDIVWDYTYAPGYPIFPKGSILTGTYSIDGYVEGSNVVTVCYDVEDVGTGYDEGATEPIIWGDPTTEVNKTVNVKDIRDLFGEVDLGTVTAPNNGQFTYTKDFAWADYGKDNCGDYQYDNTATIVETEQSASATLLVNVQCYIYETAYAKGGSAYCFLNNGFSNWGWSNKITEPGTYTWDLWAGAGQCDTSNGTLVGSVTVVYSGGYVTVTYNVAFPYIIKETHVYAGKDMFPKVKQGKTWVSTVAPGQYTNIGPFTGTIYVIAHAVIGIPDPNFGP
jgi:hypothetical protein